LENALNGFEDEPRRYRHQLDSAERRLASYRIRNGGNFAFAKELWDKQGQLHPPIDADAAGERQETTLR
jgi:hypothetical protein